MTKRQLEIYQWLLRQSGLKVSNIGYIVYCNGSKDSTGSRAFDNKMSFTVKVIAYEGNDEWIEPILLEISRCLTEGCIKETKCAQNCAYCKYRKLSTAAGNI